MNDIFHTLRIVGNISLPLSYIYMLNVNFDKGIRWKIISTILTIPSMMILGLWDGIFLTCFFVSIEIFTMYRRSKVSK